MGRRSEQLKDLVGGTPPEAAVMVGRRNECRQASARELSHTVEVEGRRGEYAQASGRELFPQAVDQLQRRRFEPVGHLENGSGKSQRVQFGRSSACPEKPRQKQHRS